MGNTVSHRPSRSSTGKLILSDGTIHEFNTPITAAELMLDHPHHIVVEITSHPLPSSISGKINNNSKHPIIPLPADKNLEKDKLYFMLPMRNRGKTTSFSLQEIQRLVLRSKKRDVNSMAVLSSATGFVPLLVRFVCTVGSGSEIESIVKMSRKGRFLEEEEKKELVTLGEEEIWPEYVTEMRRQVSGRRWKPSLDTIVEKGVKQNVRHWLV